MPPLPDEASFTVRERPDIPILGLLFGSAAMVPFPVLAAAAWAGPPHWSELSLALLIRWGAGILSFLAGVRRGLSFRTPGGERPEPLVTMLWLFLLAFAALAVPASLAALVLLAVGFASLAVFDPAAARRGEAPLFFARLRPLQMLVPVASLLVAAARVVHG